MGERNAITNRRFSERDLESGVEVTSLRVTLHPVLGGNLRKRKLSKQEFLERYGRRRNPLATVTPVAPGETQ